MITYDHLMLKNFIKEEIDFITDGRINKIQQPTRREFIFAIRNNGNTRQFYINIQPQMYHICFMSDENFQKRLIKIPQKPPMFCMLLRKYLLNSRIAKVNQPDGERIIELYVETYNELGDKIYLCLAIELMGKYSNVILYNCDTDIIIGAAHNVGADKSRIREVYGTIPYTYPPQDKNNGFLYERYAFLLNLHKCTPEELHLKIYTDKNQNIVTDNYYANLTALEKFKTLKNKYKLEISNQLKKCKKSLNEMNYQLQKSSDYDKFRLYGDLLMANLYFLKDFTEEALIYNYEKDKQIKIKLNKTKTIKDNANDFYKKYSKSKNATQKLAELIEEQTSKKNYLNDLLYSIDISNDIKDLSEIELENKETANNKKQNNLNITKLTLKNETIYIGKNNKQNDYIISKLASEDDLWFHTKDCPGSHILLKAQNPTDDLILECAKLAKQHSSGANSSKIGVIYTKRKYLRKPPKANLGYVTYKNEKEIIID